MITVSGISKTYGETKALVDVSFLLDEGVTVLLGRNGAGKSTLLRILAGAEPADAGTIERDGTVLDGAGTWRMHKRRCGWLPQSTPLVRGLTVEQFLVYGGWLKEVARSEAAERTEQVLAAVDMVEHRHTPLVSLSGGMLRRVGLAQALFDDPDLVLLDEPSAGLDPVQRATFHRLVAEASATRTVVLSTHLLEDVAVVAQRVIVIDSGVIRFDGPADELAGGREGDRAERLRAGFLGVIGGDTSR